MAELRVLVQPAKVGERLVVGPLDVTEVLRLTAKALWSRTRSGEVRCQRFDRCLVYVLDDLGWNDWGGP